jgi:hypothetical protein
MDCATHNHTMDLPDTLPPPYEFHTPKRLPSPQPEDLGPARQTTPLSPLPSEQPVLPSPKIQPAGRARSAPPNAPRKRYQHVLSIEPFRPHPYLPRPLLQKNVGPLPDSPILALARTMAPTISFTGPSAISQLNGRFPVESMLAGSRILIPAVEHQEAQESSGHSSMPRRIQHAIAQLRETHSRDDERNKFGETLTKGAYSSRRTLRGAMLRYHEVLQHVWIDTPLVLAMTGGNDEEGVRTMFSVTYDWVVGLRTSLKTAYQAGALHGWSDEEYLLLLAEIRPSRLILCVWQPYRRHVAQWLVEQTI